MPTNIKIDLNCVLGLVFVAGFVGGIVIGYINFTRHGTPIVRNVIPHLDYVSRLTNAEEIAEELEKALKALEPYSGNPVCACPTLETNFDYIKSVMKKLIEDAREVSQLRRDDYEYQQFIHNAHNLAKELEKNLKYAAEAYFVGPFLVGWGIAAVALLVAAFKTIVY